jgi:hypothetical protein
MISKLLESKTINNLERKINLDNKQKIMTLIKEIGN